MANRRKLYYVITDDYDDDGDFNLYFRSFRAALRMLKRITKMSDGGFYEGFTLRRKTRRSGDSWRTLVGLWGVNDKGSVVSHDRDYCKSMHRQRVKHRREKRFKLTHNGMPYTPPPNPLDPDDLPF